jgi:hypothetical protein
MRLISAALEHDKSRAVFEDRLERLNRLGIGEREQLAFARQTPAQRRHEIRRSDDHRQLRHRSSLSRAPKTE